MGTYNHIESALVHGGIYGDETTGAVNTPIYQTSTYEQDGLGKLRAGWEYSRSGNPTRAALESLIAELESGTAGFAFASGMAAIAAVLSLFESGDTVIISDNVYGGTFRILDKVWSRFGISYLIEDTADLDALETKITKNVKAILVESPANPRAHYEQTGPEIFNALDGNIDYVVAGAGSGGTFSGVLKYLKEQNPAIMGILADPVGSTMGGGEHAKFEIEGIGNDFIADTMDMTFVDKVIKITDKEAFGATRLLAMREGIFAGSSSGAAMAAVSKFAATIGKGNIVTIFPDRGDRYFSKGLYG